MGSCGHTMGLCDSVTLVQPAVQHNDHKPDDVCHGVAAPHFLAALWLDPHRLLCYAYMTILPQKYKNTNKEQKWATTLSKKAPTKSLLEILQCLCSPHQIWTVLNKIWILI